MTIDPQCVRRAGCLHPDKCKSAGHCTHGTQSGCTDDEPLTSKQMLALKRRADNVDGFHWPELKGELQWAVAEIERLTARVAELEATPGERVFRGVMKDNADIAADNDRLRAALEKIAKDTPEYLSFEIARKVLAESTTGAAYETSATHHISDDGWAVCDACGEEVDVKEVVSRGECSGCGKHTVEKR